MFYNKIAAALYPGKKEILVSEGILISLLAKRTNPFSDSTLTISGRKIHLSKNLPNLSLTIFEGGHEMLVPSALALPPIDENKNFKSLHILTIGDSNGAFDYGWPEQMKKLQVKTSKQLPAALTEQAMLEDGIDEETEA